jgi:hypothetical protein
VQSYPETFHLLIPLAGFMHCRFYIFLWLFAVILNT